MRVCCAQNASLANLKQLSQSSGMHWLKPVVDLSPTFTAALTGYMPTIILAVFMSVLPGILGCKAHSWCA